MSYLCLSLFIFLLQCVVSEAAAIDATCVLNTIPARDPGQYTNVLGLGRTQKCLVPIGGGGAQVIIVSLNANSIPIIRNGIATIGLSNLDQGSVPSDISNVYIHELTSGSSKSYGAGQLLGPRLGGSGTFLANLFPLGSANVNEHAALQAQIYQCLKSSKATLATIRWTVLYLSTKDTRPDQIKYHVFFANGQDECSAAIEKTIGN